MKKIPYFLLVLTVLVLLVFLGHKEKLNNTSSVDKIVYVELANQKIKVDVVSTPESRSRGLSGRTSLNESEGMLFVFDYASNYQFWMKDMNFPIDIIWISEDMKITYIKKNARPESYPEGFGPNEKTSKYVLEVFSGFTDKNNLNIGDSVKFLP